MHFASLSFIYTNVCTSFEVTLKSLKTLFINNPTRFDHSRPSSGISSFISSLSCCYSIHKMFKIFIKTALLSCCSICFVSVMRAVWRRELTPPHNTHHRPVNCADVYRERRYQLLCEYNFSS